MPCTADCQHSIPDKVSTTRRHLRFEASGITSTDPPPCRRAQAALTVCLVNHTAMLAEYRAHRMPDGKITFLAADPHAPTRGIGTALLAELERKEAGKTVFFTPTATAPTSFTTIEALTA